MHRIHASHFTRRRTGSKGIFHAKVLICDLNQIDNSVTPNWDM